MPSIEIDGRKIEVPEGSTVMDAADRLGIYIPRFCYHRKLSVAANCRMCLVDVDKAPKPLPACATPVTDGMKVSTRSEKAIQAQKGVMEFLLINHPLDCPICDQGGECQLQDLAVGYGSGASRYREEKRVVVNKYLGPLIATDMTRCIHCTRCVRFGQEIAGQMELGQAFRGEHSEIMPFVAETVDSELSGNMIDLCPVGALTSKPFRYTARPWELSRRFGVSPHDGLGANLIIQVKKDRVMRVLPHENEAINECWLADRDRFSYQALNSEERLLRPMVRHAGEWVEVDWQAALEYVAGGLRDIVQKHGPGAVGALASPHSTLEELHLLQKLLRGLGSDNVDHRLRQADFRSDGKRAGVPWLGQSIEEIERADAILLVGSNVRKEQPLLAHRIRQAVKRKAHLAVINPVDTDMLCRVAARAVVPPGEMVSVLAAVVEAAARKTGAPLPPGVDAAGSGPEVAEAIAGILCEAEHGTILLGSLAQHHPRAAELHALAAELARLAGARLGFMAEAANSVGAHIAGVLPRSEGLHARAMFEQPRRAYLLLHAEPELDAYDPRTALAALKQAGLVVALSPFRHHAVEYANVLLPVAPFTETAGTYINMEGRVQSFAAAVRPLGETRPAWKVLRVLGSLLGLAGFEQQSAEEVRREVLPEGEEGVRRQLDNGLCAAIAEEVPASGAGLVRIGEVPIYQLDPLTRRAPALQATRDARPPLARIHPDLMRRLGLREGETVRLRQGAGQATLPVTADAAVPDGCVHVAAGHPLTAGLGGMFDLITVERA